MSEGEGGERTPAELSARLRAPRKPTQFNSAGELQVHEVYPSDEDIEAADAIDSLQAQVEVLREALHWYAEHVAGCRKIGSVGEPFQQALARDGGQKARAALTPSSDAEMGEKT